MSGDAAARTRQGWAAHGMARTQVKVKLPTIARMIVHELAFHLEPNNHAMADPGIIAALTVEVHELVRLLKEG